MARISLLTAFVAFFSRCDSLPPSDEQLILNFEDSKQHFESLREALCADENARTIMLDPKWSKPPVSEKEKAFYYTIFKQLGLRGVYYDGNCSFRLPVWLAGFTGGGDYKGYTYRPQTTARNVDNLEHIDTKDLETALYRRKIADSWYLYFYHYQ